jgi:hypothetical protein
MVRVWDVTIYFLITLISFVGMELLSFAGLIFIDMREGKSLRLAYKDTLKLNSFYVITAPYGNFDPLNSQYFLPGATMANLTSNDWGFFGNDNADAQLNVYPEKPQNLFRVILLGGSVAWGECANSNATTISAQIENFLNANNKDNRRSFQVLNFAQPGAASFDELKKHISEFTLTQPDAVIILDGWNDIFYVAKQATDIQLPHMMANWNYLSYSFFEFVHGLRTPRESTPPPVLTFTYVIASRLGKWLTTDTKSLLESKKSYRQAKLAVYESHPDFKKSGVLMKNKKFAARNFRTNIEAMAAFSAAREVLFFQYLQPIPYKKPLTADEQQRIVDVYNRTAHKLGPSWSPENMEQFISLYYPTLQKAVELLSEKYRSNLRTHFYDYTDFFKEEKAEVFCDNVHLNEFGQKVIAYDMAKNLIEALEISSK